MDLNPIYHYIDRHLDDHIAMLQEYVRQPSVSVSGLGVSACAELLAGYYRDLGCQEVELLETNGFPGVWAYYDAGASKTLINYNMFDVRSVGDESQWSHPPFSAAIEPRGEFPQVVYGRGALAPKGPYAAWLCALKSIIATTGTLPVNIAFLAEGDEILGSPNYAQFIDRYRDILEDAVGCLYLRATQNRSGELPLVLGYKGLLTFEVQASAKRWGRGPTRAPAHSATRPIVDSPAWRLVQALSTLMTAGGNQSAIDGITQIFTNPAQPLPEDEQLISDLLARYQDQPWNTVIPGLAGAGVERFANDVSGPEVLRQYIYGSSFNMQGIYAGYTGPGSRTFTIPDVATALFDARLITDLSPQAVVEKIQQHLSRHGYPDVQVRMLGGYPSSRTSLESPLVQSFLNCIGKYNGQAVIWPYQGYGGPWSLFATEFGAPIVFGTGIGHGGNNGAADEFFVLDGGGVVAGLPEVEKFCVDVLYDFASR